MSESVLIIDPVFRASRLQYTMYMVEALHREKITAKVLCRRDYDSDLFDEMTEGTHFQMFPEIDLPEDFWFGDLPKSCLDQVEEFIKDNGTGGKITGLWFSGFEEWRKVLEQRKETGKGIDWERFAVGMVLYDGRFLLRRNRTFGSVPVVQWLRNFKQWGQQGNRKQEPADKKLELTNWLRRQVRSLHFGLLDERVYEGGLAKSKTALRWKHFWLPDPGPNIDFSPNINKGIGRIRVLLVGLQTKRKGLHEVCDAVVGHEFDLADILFILTGRLSKETENLRIKMSESSLFELREGFFLEEDLINSFISADYVLLPYDRSFAGSSGVLAHAAAVGRPLICTDHGLIGYRVKERDLGLSYPYGNAERFLQLLKKLPRPGVKKYGEWQNNLREYAKEHSRGRHLEILRKEIYKIYLEQKN